MRIHRHTFLGRTEAEQIHVRRDGDNVLISTVNSSDYESIELLLNRRRVQALIERLDTMIEVMDYERTQATEVSLPPVPRTSEDDYRDTAHPLRRWSPVSVSDPFETAAAAVAASIGTSNIYATTSLDELLNQIPVSSGTRASNGRDTDF